MQESEGVDMGVEKGDQERERETETKFKDFFDITLNLVTDVLVTVS